MFGDQGSTKLNNKRSVQLFVKFLSDLVPYEPAEYLKVSVSRCLYQVLFVLYPINN